MAKKTTVLGMLSTQGQAEQIVLDLQSAGFGTNDVSVLFPDQRGSRDFAHENHTKAPEGAITGVSLGGLAGGTLGLLAGIGALAIPGIGPFIAAGPIISALTGAAAFATVGGITGALVGMGIPEIEAKQYDGKLRSGGILMSVHIDGDDELDRATKLLKDNGATHIATAVEAHVHHGHA